MTLSPRAALDAGLNLIDQRRWAEAVTALERAQVDTPSPAAAYWLAQARFEHARHSPAAVAADRLAQWRRVVAELAAARALATRRVEVDTTLLDLEARVACVEVHAALTSLAQDAAARRPGARAALAALIHTSPEADASASLPSGRWRGGWLVTISSRFLGWRRPGKARQARVYLIDLGAGVWLGQVVSGRGRRRRIVGYFDILVGKEDPDRIDHI